MRNVRSYVQLIVFSISTWYRRCRSHVGVNQLMRTDFAVATLKQ